MIRNNRSFSNKELIIDIITYIWYNIDVMVYNFYIDKKGYPRWKNSRLLVHRTVAAKKVGGKIFSGFVVHHIDGNKRNFRPSNLWSMSRGAHSRFHYQARKSFSF